MLHTVLSFDPVIFEEQNMSAGLVILLSITAIIVYLVVVPITLHINTYSDKYFVRFPGIFSLRLGKRNETWGIWYTVFFLRFRIKGSFNAAQHRKKDKKELKSGKRKTVNLKRLWFPVRILQTFRLKKLKWDFDSGDFPLNAQLYPVTGLINSQKINISVNFNEENNICLIVYTQLFRIIFITIRYFMFNR